MYTFERTFQSVTRIEIHVGGLFVCWFDESKIEKVKLIERNVFAKEFSIVAKQRGESKGITIKVED